MNHQLSEALRGAVFAISSIRDAGILFNMPDHCRFYHNAVTNRDFETIFSYESFSYPELDFYRNSDDASFLLNNKGPLTEILDYIHRRDYQFVLVVNFPGAELTGKAFAQKMKAVLPRIPWTMIEADHFTGNFAEGYQKALIQTLHSLRLSMQLSRPKTVNILGLNLTQRCFREDRAMLEQIFEACGLEVTTFGGLLDDIRTLRKTASAALNIVICPEYGEKIAAFLKETLSSEYRILKSGYPIGSKAVTDMICELCDYFKTDPQEALSKVRYDADREKYFLNTHQEELKNHSFAIKGEASQSFAISRFLIQQAGMLPKAIETTIEHEVLSERLTELLTASHVDQVIGSDFSSVAADVYFSDGNTLGEKCTDADHDPRCIAFEHPVYRNTDLLERTMIGGRGGLFLMEEILRAVR